MSARGRMIDSGRMSSSLPSGTVTFLFTDIEGSTRLLHALGGASYHEALTRHQEILRDAARAAGGREIDTQGDSFFFAFSRATHAALAAVNAQRELAAQTWPDNATLRVRKGSTTRSRRSAPIPCCPPLPPRQGVLDRVLEPPARLLP